MNIYLSSPVSTYQKDWNIKVAYILREAGIKVGFPQEITPQNQKHTNFSNYVYKKCIDMILESDIGLLLLPYGRDCAWEAGYFKGQNKPFVVYINKFHNGNMEFLRDWMVKGGVSEVIVDDKSLYARLKKDKILQYKSINFIKNVNELPFCLLNLISISAQKSYLGVGAVVVKNRKILMVQEKEDSESYFRRKGMWGFPTRTLKNKDPKDQSLVSLFEETGLKGNNPEFLSAQNIPNAVGLFYSVQVENNLSIKNGKWFNIDQILKENIYLRPTYSQVLRDLKYDVSYKI